jgi:hypothetical protein
MSSRRVVLWGDSHAAQWQPGFDLLGRLHGWRVESLTKATCPPMALPLRSPVLGRAFRECTAFDAAVLARIRAERPALVVLGVARHYSAPRTRNPLYGIAVYDDQWLSALRSRVAELRSMGLRVVVLGPTPKALHDAPDCLAAHLDDLGACATPRALAVDVAGEAAERRAVLAAGGSYVDVADWLCAAQACGEVLGNLLVHRDDNHLTAHVVRWLSPLLGRAVDL